MGAISAPGPDDASAAYGEHRLEVVLGEDLEGDHGVRALDAVEPGQPFGDHLGEPVVLRNAHDRDEVPVAGDRVGLGHAVDAGELAAEGRERVAPSLDEDHRVRHVPPYTVRPCAIRASTLAAPASWAPARSGRRSRCC